MIEIDGSMMEGGGQLLRMATTYSAVMCKPVTVNNIRANRSPPGLKPQHYTTLKALAKISNAKVTGLKLGSDSISFIPGSILSGSHSFDIGTAGSIGLMLQCLAPTAAFADGSLKLKIKGGTAVKWSPPVRFVNNIVWRAFRKMGFNGEITIQREGFYPRGGGLVETRIDPIYQFESVKVEEINQIEHVEGISLCGKLPYHVAERQAKSAHSYLKQKGLDSKIEKIFTDNKPPFSPGSVLVLWVRSVHPLYVGADALGERGKPAERVGQEAAEKLVKHINTKTTVDYHTADNLILPCSLANGESVFTTSKITSHILTAIELSKIITKASFEVEGKEGKPGRIICQGIGLKNPNK